MKWRNVAIVAILILPLVIILAAGFGLNPRSVPSVLLQKPAPECKLRSLAGEPMALSSFWGKPVVLNFWATWCVPCEAEHELLVAAAKHYGERAQFLGVVYQDDPKTAQRYLERRGHTYPHLADPASRCSIDYGVAGVPETFFIDAAGVVRHKQVGPVSTKLIREWLEPLLTGGPR